MSLQLSSKVFSSKRLLSKLKFRLPAYLDVSMQATPSEWQPTIPATHILVGNRANRRLQSLADSQSASDASKDTVVAALPDFTADKPTVSELIPIFELVLNTPPREPKEPGESDCCGNGCFPCVYEIYNDQLDDYAQDQRDYSDLQLSLFDVRVAPSGVSAPKNAATASMSAFEQFEALMREQKAAKADLEAKKRENMRKREQNLKRREEELAAEEAAKENFRRDRSNIVRPDVARAFRPKTKTSRNKK